MLNHCRRRGGRGERLAAITCASFDGHCGGGGWDVDPRRSIDRPTKIARLFRGFATLRHQGILSTSTARIVPPTSRAALAALPTQRLPSTPFTAHTPYGVWLRTGWR